jgi:hypothetical protein
MRGQLKQFILRALNRMEGRPMKDKSLLEAAHGAFEPPPTVGDINAAKRELELDGFIHGATDDFDKSITWTLTPKGQHKANQLG